MKKTLLSSAALAAAAFSVAAYASGGGGPVMGPPSSISRPAFHGFYDGHKVTYLNTDVSSNADATAMHINYSARIGLDKGLPEIYLVEGKAAAGQLAIFGSEPGEVLIRLRAASLNHLDIWVRQGLPSVPKPRPRRVRERPDSGGVRVVAKERLAGRLNAGRRGGSLPAAGGRRI